MKLPILIRGGGDLASGVALRLHHTGLKVVISELPQPLAVRRAVSFSEAVYEGRVTVEDVSAQLVKREQLPAALDADEIPVLVDPQASILSELVFAAVVDARLIKTSPQPIAVTVPLHIGLGPGFSAGENCHATIETRRSHTLGRVYWSGAAQPDSGQPEGDPRRVLRACANGLFVGYAQIGEHVEEGQEIAVIANQHPVISPFRGVLRGLIRPGLQVTTGLKIGDIDPRDDQSACFLVSDKALAVGGGVLEALLTKEDLRARIWAH